MNFISSWITTADFENIKPIDIFHKQFEPKEIEKSAFSNYHSHFVKEFYADGEGKYEIRISADDYYKLYINDKFVCQGPAPAYTSSYNYNQIDISNFINKGENMIAVHVYYQGLINRVWNSGDNRMGLIADILHNGEFLFGTDESWLYDRAEEYSGDVTEYSTQFREDIDFRKKKADWKNITSSKDGYKNSKFVRFQDWSFKDNPVPNVEVYTVKPVRVIKTGEAVYIMDFGHEITGQIYFKVKGKRGQKLCVKCGEELEEDGSVRFQMRCNCNYCDVCTLSGDTDEFDFFDYKAFRYLQVECDEDIFKPDEFYAIVRHHKFEERCVLKSDIPYLEEIWNICKNAIKYSTQEGYLDCPSREKGQYLGDFTVSGLSHLYLTGDFEMYRKTLFDFAESAKVCKGIMAVAPGSFMLEIADFSLQYPLQVMNYYKLTGDIETLKELYPTVEGIIKDFEQFERADGLIENVNVKWNLVDWPKNLRDGYCVETDENYSYIPVHNVINAFYIGAVEMMENMQNIIGMTTEQKSDKLKAAFLNVFYDSEKKVFYDDERHTHSSLHSNALPLYFDIVPENAYNNIKALIMEKGLSCGVQFSYFVLKGLGRIGAYDEEFELLTNESEHSWVNMIREGATTCFEAWGKEQKWNTSLCHPWASAPIIILIEDIMKLEPKDILEGDEYIKEIYKDGRKYSIKLISRSFSV